MTMNELREIEGLITPGEEVLQAIETHALDFSTLTRESMRLLQLVASHEANTFNQKGLVTQTGLLQSDVSYHIIRLSDAGLIRVTKRGRSIVHAASQAKLEELRDLLLAPGQGLVRSGDASANTRESPPLDGPLDLDRVLLVARALAIDVRLVIVEVLRLNEPGKVRATDLCNMLNLPIGNVKWHVTVLRDAELIRRPSRGHARPLSLQAAGPQPLVDWFEFLIEAIDRLSTQA